jgi:hypothetical protein
MIPKAGFALKKEVDNPSCCIAGSQAEQSSTTGASVRDRSQKSNTFTTKPGLQKWQRFGILRPKLQQFRSEGNTIPFHAMFLTDEIQRTRNADNDYKEFNKTRLLGGQVLVRSNTSVTLPSNEDEAFTTDYAVARFYHASGIDQTQEYLTNIGRPVTIVCDGQVI